MHEHTRYLVGYEAIGGIRRCFQASGNLPGAKLHRSGCGLSSFINSMGTGNKRSLWSNPESDQQMEEETQAA